MKPAFGLIRSLIPVLYWGGLLLYFFNQAGSIEEAQAMGLGPTLLGLAIVGLLFSIPLISKLVWLLAVIFGGRRPPESVPPSDGGIDADAMIARYKAQRTADADPSTPPSSPSSTPRASFGRKKR